MCSHAIMIMVHGGATGVMVQESTLLCCSNHTSMCQNRAQAYRIKVTVSDCFFFTVGEGGVPPSEQCPEPDAWSSRGCWLGTAARLCQCGQSMLRHPLVLDAPQLHHSLAQLPY